VTVVLGMIEAGQNVRADRPGARERRHLVAELVQRNIMIVGAGEKQRVSRDLWRVHGSAKAGCGLQEVGRAVDSEHVHALVQPRAPGCDA
jgi:hypothetical protein